MTAAGFVYILSNPSIREGTYKIGETSGPVESRAVGLFTTGVPDPFVVEHAVYVSDRQLVEAVIHERLGRHRRRPNREFFDCPLSEAKAALDDIAKIANQPEGIQALMALQRTSTSRASSSLAGAQLDAPSREAAFQSRLGKCADHIIEIFETLDRQLHDLPGVTTKIDSRTVGCTYYCQGNKPFCRMDPKFEADVDNIGAQLWGLTREAVGRYFEVRDVDYGLWIFLTETKQVDSAMTLFREAYSMRCGQPV